MDEILARFQSESMAIVLKLLAILESIEGNYSQFKRLEEYGQLVDRIMGAATSLSIAIPELKKVLDSMGKYSQLCKLVSYKCSQISNNEDLYNVVVALLLDATEMLEDMTKNLTDPKRLEVKEYLSKTFIDRLTWISERLPKELRGTLSGKSEAESIEAILKSLGMSQQKK